jgi:hypothetical protein
LSGGEHSVGEFKVELVRVERFADPVDLFGVVGIGQDGQQRRSNRQLRFPVLQTQTG